MFCFKGSISLNMQGYDDYEFGISLQDRTEFLFCNCYYKLFRGNNGHEDERLVISYYSNKDDSKEAWKAIKESINCLQYIFLIPLNDISGLDVSRCSSLPVIGENRSIRKVQQLMSISTQIGKFKSTKIEFDGIMQLFSKGYVFSLTDAFSEDAYLNFFKIIENIAKKYFSINGNKVKIESTVPDLKNCLTKILNDDCRIKYSDNKLADLTGIIKKKILEDISSDLFPKVSYFCNMNNIKINENQLAKVIKLRNKIAHGEVIDMNKYCNEYVCAFEVCKEMISKHYFNKSYMEINIDCMARNIYGDV